MKNIRHCIQIGSKIQNQITPGGLRDLFTQGIMIEYYTLFFEFTNHFLTNKTEEDIYREVGIMKKEDCFDSFSLP